jgi:dTDP-4-dehydrorhamnose reductase
VKKKILFTGGSGLLSLNWAIQIRDNYEVILGLHERDIYLKGTKSIKIKLNSDQNISDFLTQIKPDILVHTAGLTSVEECELNPEQTNSINSFIPQLLAKHTNKLGIKFIHISTDHLFDGLLPFTSEDTPVSPVNEYGKSKALAEKLILKENPSALILRTNFFGWGTSYRLSFSDIVLKTLRANKTINLFDDVYYTPILINQFVEIVNLLILNNNSGIFNVVSNERITKYQFGLILAKKFGLNIELIQKGSIIDDHNLVQRPKDMSLNNKKVLEIINYKLLSIEKQIDILKAQELYGIASELKSN